MPTSKFSKLFQFHEALKEAPSQPMPKLGALDLSVIFERRSPVNGRYVAAENCQVAIQKQYPNLFDAKSVAETVQTQPTQEATPETTAPVEPDVVVEAPRQEVIATANETPVSEQTAPTAVVAPRAQKITAESSPIPNGSIDPEEARRLVRAALDGSATSNGVEQITDMDDMYKDAA